MKSPAQGAATIGKEFQDKGGVYLENCEVTGLYPDDREYDHVPDLAGYAEHAFNEELANQLWIDSLEMIVSKARFEAF